MRLHIIFIIFVHTLFISASHGFLDPETTVKNVVLPKLVRKFTRINLNRTETLNEKNYRDQTTTIMQETTSIPTATQEATTLNEKINSYTDLMTTKESQVPLDDFTTKLAPSTQATTKGSVLKNSGVETDRSVLWFFGGAFAGVVISFIVFYVYSFFKSRTQSIYQNL